MRGFIAGILGLTLLEVLVSSKTATQNLGGFFGGAATVFDHLVNPTVPLIPDLRKSGTTSSSAIGSAPQATPQAYIPPSRTPTSAPSTTVNA